MSRALKMLSVPFVVLMAMLAALLVGVVNTAPLSASAATGTPFPSSPAGKVATTTNPNGTATAVPPVPISFDPSGTDQDEYAVPCQTPQRFWYFVAGNQMTCNKSYLSGGEAVAIDVFSPLREDWLRGDDAYLRK